MRRRVPPALAIVLVLLACPGARAGTPIDELRTLFGVASRILEDPETEGRHEERLRQVRNVTRRMFDFREAARLSLGPPWQERTPAEQDEFVQLYGDLLERAFIGWIARAQIAGGIKITFVGESVDGGLATVRTTVLGRSGHELPFDYRMIERSDGWAVRDVVIDGVSLTGNFRAQFARVLQASSYPELVSLLQGKVSGPVMFAAPDKEGREPAPAPAAAAMATSGSSAAGGAAGAGLVPDGPGTRTGPAPPRSSWASAAPARAGEPTYALQAALPAEPARAPDPVGGSDRPRALEPPPAPERLSQPEPARGLERERAPAAKPSRPPKQASVAERRPDQGRPSSPEALRPPRPAGTIQGFYWVQVAAFKSLEAAMRLASLLRGENRAVPDRWAVVIAPAPAGTAMAKVRVGPFTDLAEATSNLRQLEARGFKPFIAEERD